MVRFVLDKKKGKGGDYLGEWRKHDFHGENPLIWRGLRGNGVGVMREEGRRLGVEKEERVEEQEKKARWF